MIGSPFPESLGDRTLRLAMVLLLCGSSACAPGSRVEHEEVVREEVDAGISNSDSNSCTAINSWLVYSADELEGYFEYFLADEQVPEVEFGDRMVMLSFSMGCHADGNELMIDRVFFDGDLLLVYADMVMFTREGPGDGPYRAYNVSYVDLPRDSYAVEVDTNVIWPE